MQINPCEPFVVGTKVTSRLLGQLEMSVVVRATFALAPNQPVTPLDDPVAKVLSGDLFEESDDDRLGAPTWASDFADYKLKAEVLLQGTCYPPGGRPLPACPVRFAVGSWSKMLHVYGRRVWTERAFQPISEPVAFSSMPLTYGNAFGGPTSASNPVGKGFETPELPSIESPSEPIRSKKASLAPASFAPLSPYWTPRKNKVGTDYGKTWKKTRAPFYAADFDWTYFNAAPPDQWLESYLRGDESLVFENLHPDAARFTAKLPGIVPRVLCRRVDGTTTDLTMNLDTLVADVDRSRLVLLWRGLARVSEDDLADVKTLFLAKEALGARRSEKDLVAELDEFDADPIAYLRARLLTPGQQANVDEAAKLRAEAGASPALPPPIKDPGGALDHVATLLPKSDDDAGAQAIARARNLLAKHGDKRAALAAKNDPPTFGGLMSRLSATLAKQKAAAAEQGRPTGQIEEAEARVQAAIETQRNADASATAKRPSPSQLFDRASAEGAAAAAASTGDDATRAPAIISVDKLVSGGDLSGVDLSGRDLSGVDLSRARLRGAKLVGTKLVKANLTQADLSLAELEGADLSEARLSQTNFGQAKARQMKAEGAALDRTVFSDTELEGASFAGSVGTMVVFNQAKLGGAKFAGARFHKVVFVSSTMDGVDFRKAELDRCQFLEVVASDARFDGAKLVITLFFKSRFPGAIFALTSGERASFQESFFEAADFRYARLRKSQFIGTDLTRAKLHAADFRGSRFDRAVLENADLEKADLLGANFNKARLSAANFAGANLFDAKFLGAMATARCNFEGANLKRAIWEQP